MGSKNCMNDACCTTTLSEWKKGWSLKSGGFATLCHNCGLAYENSVFYETFHFKESGWRECKLCRKIIHCGCTASRYLYQYMDFGGISCLSCAKHLEIQPLQPVQIPSDLSCGPFMTNCVKDVYPLVTEHKRNDDKFSTERLLQLTKAVEATDMISKLEQVRREESMLKTVDTQNCVSNLRQQCSSPAFLKTDIGRPKQEVKDTHESLTQQSLNFSLATPLGSSSSRMPFVGEITEGVEQSKSSFQHGKSTKQALSKPVKNSPASCSETNKGNIAQKRFARPPADGRGRTQLLPRYWPKITDQELQQLSGDLKSSIVPLFEKILSASDAGRIGRLVLPKACAEAYFPPINQSEGIPIRIQDIKGKEWTFQFRFWPNNNSRMYVLEGVTPCIQNMQVQAGDVVTFSRIDPGGQLVIGYRKATNNSDVLDSHATILPNGNSSGEMSYSGVTDTLLTVSYYFLFLLDSFFYCFYAYDNDIILFPYIRKTGGRASDDSIQQSDHVSEKKLRNIKNKRLLMPNDEAVELRITWEEAQELLRPSPSAKPTIVLVEDLEFEEFDEPPIFGKRTIFTSRLSGELEQLAQCDICSKWRRLPVHALLSAKWTCSDNNWDSNRCSCSALDDISLQDLEALFTYNNEFKKRRISDNVSKEGEPSGLDALATIAVLGDNIGDMGESSAGATTRHPRHRPGCSCIVCIQPPSGKGKHEPTCKCNVCSTVKRRFKTLMMRKKKRQSEREAELSQVKDKPALAKICFEKEEEDIAGNALLDMNHQKANEDGNQTHLEEAKMGRLDLNCDPYREEDGMSLTTLMSVATLPFDMFLGKPDALPTLEASILKKEDNVAGEGAILPRDSRQENNPGDG
ncbi:B3 domain-containing transcription repressor VAL1-like isoform X2 [Primulina huaijiensis]|uniref:B3 domain-containing transcription repressor VAL1-like isoform X2 n=1 Tax=Primulina huaijiensis TaxID=1492673 RepID=UPI003CC76A30